MTRTFARSAIVAVADAIELAHIETRARNSDQRLSGEKRRDTLGGKLVGSVLVRSVDRLVDRYADVARYCGIDLDDNDVARDFYDAGARELADRQVKRARLMQQRKREREAAERQRQELLEIAREDALFN